MGIEIATPVIERWIVQMAILGGLPYGPVWWVLAHHAPESRCGLYCARCSLGVVGFDHLI